MNASDIIRLLNTNHYAPANLDEVNKLCKEFPEFSTAHLLKVRILEALGYEKKKELKIAAVYAMNREKLMQLVSDAKKPAVEEAEAQEESPEIIEFSEEGSVDADIIIEQHAPYAGPETGSDLLELDDEPDKETFFLDMEGTEAPELATSEEALSPPEKDETDLEEPERDLDGVPAIDQNHLISNFIKEDPGPIRADKQTGLKGDVSVASIREHDGFITDTLAQIYVKQGLYAKAIYAYEKLSLKYPEKSAYFAAQIEKIRNINHS